MARIETKRAAAVRLISIRRCTSFNFVVRLASTGSYIHFNVGIRHLPHNMLDTVVNRFERVIRIHF